MRIKKSDLLKRLATDSGKTANQVAEIIISELLKNKVIEDTPENWGVSVFDAINEDVTEEKPPIVMRQFPRRWAYISNGYISLSRIWI